MIRTMLARMPARRAAAGNVLVGTKHGDRVWLFTLDGTVAPATEHDGTTLTTAVPVSETVTYGRNNMPPFLGQLTEAQIRAVSSYIVNDLFK